MEAATASASSLGAGSESEHGVTDVPGDGSYQSVRPSSEEALAVVDESAPVSSSPAQEVQPTAPAPRSPVQQRLHESYRSDRRYLREMVRSKANQRDERVGAILALKSSLDASAARISAQNAVRKRRAEQLAEADARAHDTLLSQGLNPYEVTRRREVTQEAMRERTAIERNIREKQAKVLQHLEVERVQQQRREKIAAENRAYEKKYQREMGRAAVEERVQAYIVSRTGKETLDPTGKAVRIYPSQETALKDNSFGLGRSLVHSTEQRKRMIEQVRNQSTLHREAGPSSMLLPRQSSTRNNDPGEAERETQQSQALPPLRSSSPSVSRTVTNTRVISGPRPGEDLRELNHTLVSLSVDSSAAKLPPLAPNHPNNQRQQSPDMSESTGALKKRRARSVLEQKMLDNARRRQREAVYAHKQVVWGREFAGDAFRADPPALWFKDFDVGAPFTLAFTLTNVSNTFNQFKLLEIESEGVRELFEIKYERPGRMSAGMTCRLTITFTGDRREDIDTWLPVAAPTGVTRVPIKCTCKKAVPVLSAMTVCFEDVVTGDSRSIALTLENRGALPFTFRITKAAADHNEDTAEATEVEKQLIHADSSMNPSDSSTNGPALARDDESPREADIALVDSIGNSKAPSDADSVVNGGQVPAGSPVSRPTSPPFAATVASSEAIDDLSEEELQFVANARALTRYEPPGFGTPITFKERGFVPPYSSVPVTFTFSPAAPMRLDNLKFSLDCFEKRSATHPGAESAFSTASRSAEVVVTHEDSSAGGHLASDVVTVSAHSTDVPIFVEHELINLQCCAYGKLYRAQISIGNRGKIALKMQIKPPKALADVLKFHPSEGYVQASAVAGGAPTSADSSSFTVVQVMFRPRPEMWKRIERRGVGSEALGMLAVPVRVLVPDQRVPVFVTLVARATSSSIAVSPGALAFGDCCVGHSVSRALTITNCARVPQRVAAVARPPEVVVLNDDRDPDACADGGDLAGAGVVLLPLESRRFRVVYEPAAALPLVSSARPAAAAPVKTTVTGMAKPTIPPPPPTPLLVLQSSTFNRSYSLVCSGAGVKAPLVFSHSVVLMGATQLGQLRLASVWCTNESEQTQQLELRLPPEAVVNAQPLLRVTPMVATLAPRQRVRLEMEFFARDDVFGLVDRPLDGSECGDQAEVHCSDASGDTDASLAVEAEPVQVPSVRVSVSRSDAIEPRAAAYWASTGAAQGGAFGSRPLETKPPTWAAGIPAEPRSCHVTWTILCFRRVDQVTGGKKTLLDAVSLPLQSLTVRSTVLAAPRVRLSAEALNFGHVALGQSLRLALTLTNEGDSDLRLRARALHALGAFRVVNSSQRVLRGGGGSLELLVDFSPQAPVEFEDELELLDAEVHASCPVLRVPLRGRGVNPRLVLEPRDGVLDFADALARSRSERELTLTNASAFPLAFSVAAWPEADTVGASAPVFSFQPSAGSIPAQSSLVLRVSFHPLRARPEHYAQRFRVHVPNASERHVLSLSGRCWENQLYVFAPGANTVPAVEDVLDLPPNVSLSPLLSASSFMSALARPPTKITLTLDGGARSFFVGSTPPLAPVADADKAATAQSFELAMDTDSPHAKLFSLEPMKGSLAPGQQLSITASFRPPSPVQDASTGGGRAALAALFPEALARAEARVAQWVELRVTCTLRGGALWRPVAAKEAAQPADVRVVVLVLRGELLV